MDAFKKRARKALGGLWWQEMRHLSASDSGGESHASCESVVPTHRASG